MRPTLLPWLVLTVSACAGDAPPAATPGDDSAAPVTDTAPDSTSTGCLAGGIQVQIGTGDFAFEPLSDGDEAVIVKGPQGAWHISTAARVTGAGTVVSAGPVVYWLLPEGDVPIAGADEVPTGVALDNYDEETCSGDVVGQFALLNDYAPTTSLQEWVCSLRGASLRIEMTVTDLTTYEQSTQSLEVTARPDPETNPC